MKQGFMKKLTTRGRVLIIWAIFAIIAVALTIYAGSVSFVEVNDNGTITEYRTEEKTTEKFLEENNIVINKGDILDAPERVTTFTKINIIRSFDVELHFGGKSCVVRAVPGTVEEILALNGITYDEDDILSHDKNEYISGPTVLRVDFIERERVVEDTIIPSVTKYLRSEYDAHHLGTPEDGEEGEDVEEDLHMVSDGLKRATYDILYVNGEIAEKRLIEEHVFFEAVDSVVIVDTHPTGSATVRNEILTSRGTVMRYKKVINVTSTAYTHTGYRTASLTYPKVGTVAVDPTVISLGSKLYIESSDGESWIYGYAVAEDTGPLIKGNRIDLFMETQDECVFFGVRDAKVYILE